MCMRIAAVTMETGLLIFCACTDNHVTLLFINKVGRSKRGLSNRLSKHLYSRTSIYNIRPSIIRNLDYPAWNFIFNQIHKMGVSLKCTCALQLLLWRQVCLSSAHAQTTMWHCCLSIKWVDQSVVYLIDYPVYQLSGLPLEPRCPDNRGSTVLYGPLPL